MIAKFTFNYNATLEKKENAVFQQGSIGVDSYQVFAPFPTTTQVFIKTKRNGDLNYSLWKQLDYNSTVGGWVKTATQDELLVDGELKVVIKFDNLVSQETSLWIRKGTLIVPELTTYEALRDYVENQELRINQIIDGSTSLEFDNTGTDLISIYIEEAIKEVNDKVNTNEQNIEKIVDGTTIVKKAEQDKNGNDIVTTYETKADATSKKAEIDGRLDTAESDIDAVELRLDTAEGDIDTLQEDVLDLETANMIKSYTYNPTTHVITFTYYDNTTTSFDLPLESAIVSASYDNVTKDITFVLQSGATLVVPLDDLVSGLASETWVTTNFIPKSALKTSFSATPLDTNVISEKLAKESLDLKVDKSTISNTSTTITYVDGYYINTSGSFTANTNYKYSNIIQLKKGETLNFETRGESSSICIMYRYNDSLGSVPNGLLFVGNGAVTKYTYTAISDVEYIRVCGSKFTNVFNYSIVNNNNEIIKVSVIGEENIDVIKTQIDYEDISDTTFTRGSYVAISGAIFSGANYAFTDIITLNKYDVLNIQCSAETAISILHKYPDSIGTATGSTSIQTGQGSSVITNISYEATNEIEYIRICYRHLSRPIRILRYVNYKNKNNRNDFLIDIENSKAEVLFNDVICCGDSLTEGIYSDILGAKPKNYPYYLSKISGWTVENEGYGGKTPTTYWSNHAQLIDYSLYDAMILFLGTNGTMTDTLIADTTISGEQTYLDYADTNTGNYCKIIENALSDNPNIKIFMVNCITGSATTNNVILQQISEKYSIPLLDIKNNDIYFLNPYDTILHPNSDITHFGNIGYYILAKVIFGLLKKAIESNKQNYELPY